MGFPAGTFAAARAPRWLLASSVIGMVACGGGEARAADVCVDSRHAGTQDGSAARPFRTIQAAVGAAAPGDVIKIARGTYAEAVVVETEDLSLEGGYAGATSDAYAGGAAGDFVTRDTMNPETVVASGAGIAVLAFYDAGEATISGLIVRGGSQHGVFADGDPPSAHRLTVSRTTIEDSGSAASEGGGIYSGVPLEVRESVIRDNVGDRGAGIAADGASLLLEVSLVENNVGYGDHGGGVYAYGDVRLFGNVIRGNRAGEGGTYGWGGGIIVYGAGTVAEMRGNLVTGNFAPTEGSGTFIDDGAVATLVNELIVDNACPQQSGAGLYVDGAGTVGSVATLVNVTIAGHACPGGGNAILLERSSSATVTSSIVWGNGGSSFEIDGGSSLTVRYSDVEDGFPGDGNIQVDPAFGNPGTGDYHLARTAGRPTNSGECVFDGADSPALDAGDPAGAYAAEPDPDGGRVDMGAYGNTMQAGCFDGGGSTSASASVSASASASGAAGTGGGTTSTSTSTSTAGAGGDGGAGGDAATGVTASSGGDGGAGSAGPTSSSSPSGPGAGGDAGEGGCGAFGDCEPSSGAGSALDSGAGGGGGEETRPVGQGGTAEDADDGGDARTGCGQTDCGVARGGSGSSAPFALAAAAAWITARRRRRG